MSDRGLRIGEVAARTGTTTRTIRYYEEIGLLPGAGGREAGAHRLYDETDVQRLEEILRLKELLGVSLDELRELLAAEEARAALRDEWHTDVPDPARRHDILQEALGHIDHQLALVRGRRAEIERLEAELASSRRRVKRRLAALKPQRA